MTTEPESFPELVARCNAQFIPQKLDDFIGTRVTDNGAGARLVAEQIQTDAILAQRHGSPLKYLINGPPGDGKSMLACWLQQLLGCNKWSTQKKNGTQVKMELIDEWEASMHYKSLFGEFRLFWIDEADKIPSAAQVRFLTMLDDLPNHVAIVCTSNCKTSDFEPRFQSRFQVVEVVPPHVHEIEALLSKYCDDQQAIKNIAAFACGNVRAALLDVKNTLAATLKLAA